MAAAVASTSSHSLSDERYKVKVHVTNPVYVTEISQSDSRCSAEDALKHMKTYDLCDITVINPVFHCELPFSDPEINRFCSVDHVVQNHFYGLGIPNYERITPPSETSFSKSWVDEFPLHSAALEGDIPRIKQLLSDGYNPHQQDKESWTPIHYSCWYGKSETVKVILQQGRCSPTVENENGSTPLHFAAMRGYPKVVQLLLAHQEIDKGALDKDGKTPLHLCEECRQNEWEAVSKLLRDAMRRPAPKIDVHLLDLDSSHVVLDLVSGNNTTVHQLLRQLDLPNGCEHLFAIWIASKNLHLQMRAEHKPLLHMKSWDIIVKQLTNYKPEAEKPRLYLRRDARLALSVENKVKDPQAIKLLFDECLVNVLKSMYPATDEDAISLAAILMQIIYGDYDSKKHKSGFLNNINLRHFIPAMKLMRRSHSGKSINWAHKIAQQHKVITAKGVKDNVKLQLMYLDYCRNNFRAYGSAFFFGFAPPPQGGRNPIPVHIGINSLGLHLIRDETRKMIYSASYDVLKWECAVNKAHFKLRSKKDGRPVTITIKTKQSAIVCNLLGKMSGQMPVTNVQSKQQKRMSQRR